LNTFGLKLDALKQLNKKFQKNEARKVAIENAKEKIKELKSISNYFEENNQELGH
jgi:hypothetical protein